MKRMVFDIETIPDANAGRLLHNFEGLPDQDVVRALEQLHEQKTGKRFLPPHLHRVVAISLVFDDGEKLRVVSLGNETSPEKELIRVFFALLAKHKPQLVSWNGNHFDLPVLHYRSLFLDVDVSAYWESGDSDHSFRWNNYYSRYHQRHLDLMDVLSAFSSQNWVSLDEVARIMKLPGKMDMRGDQVYELWNSGEIKRIRNYCDWDVLNTWLVYLRFEHTRGRLGGHETLDLDARLEKALTDSGQEHLEEFLRRLRSRGSRQAAAS